MQTTISKVPGFKSYSQQHKACSTTLHNQQISNPKSNISLQGSRVSQEPWKCSDITSDSSLPCSITTSGKKRLYQLDLFNILLGSTTSLRQ